MRALRSVAPLSSAARTLSLRQLRGTGRKHTLCSPADAGMSSGGDAGPEDGTAASAGLAPAAELLGSSESDGSDGGKRTVRDASKALRKEAKAAAKADRKAARAAPIEASYKPCHLCVGAHPLLIRCRIDASGAWCMVCGKCWKKVSGGVTDGDAAHPHYAYGGLWKAKR